MLAVARDRRTRRRRACPTSTSSFPRRTTSSSPPFVTTRNRGSSAPPPPTDREVALVRLHGRHRDPLGQLEIAGRELAREHARPLDQVDDLVELPHRVVQPPAASSPATIAARRSPASTITPWARRSSRYVAADPIGTGSRPGRGPRLSPEARTPATSAATHLAVELRDEPADRAARTGRPASASCAEAGGPRRPPTIAAGTQLGGRRRRPLGDRPTRTRRAPRAPRHPSRACARTLPAPVRARRRAGRAPRAARPRRCSGKAVCDDREPPGRDVDADALGRRGRPARARRRRAREARPPRCGSAPPAAPRSRSRRGGQASPAPPAESRWAAATACVSRRIRRM